MMYLFFDLIYVAAIVRLSGYMSHDVDHLYEYLLAFILMLFVWIDLVYIESRFAPDNDKFTETVGHVMLSVHGACVLVMGLNATDFVNGLHYQAFLTAYALAKMSTGQWQFQLGYAIPRAKKHLFAEGVCSVIMVVLALGLSIIAKVADKDRWWIVSSLIFLNCLHWFSHQVVWFIFEKKELLPFEIEHLAERHSLLLIIVIGEGVISLLYVDTELDRDQYLVIFLSYAILAVFFSYVLNSDHMIENMQWQFRKNVHYYGITFS
eukprot:UN33909